jgi:hypothetical protein
MFVYCIMEDNTYIVIFVLCICLVCMMCIKHEPMMECFTNDEAIQNVANLYNTSLMTVSNMNVTQGGAITVKSSSDNSDGIIKIGAINSSRTDGTIDLASTSSINLNPKVKTNINSDLAISGTTTMTGDVTTSKRLNAMGPVTLGNTFGPITTRIVTGTVAGKDKTVTLTCDQNEILTGCSCYSAWGCNGVTYTPDGKSCNAYAQDNHTIAGSAVCVKIGNGL